MMRLIHSLLVVMAVQSICIADVTKLSAEDREALRAFSRFHEIHAATNLPPAVFAFCADHNGRLAGPGQKWEVSDVITDAKLPRKRMISAVTDGNYFVVHYEGGGYAHSLHVLVAKVEAGHGKLSLVWHGVCFEPSEISESLLMRLQPRSWMTEMIIHIDWSNRTAPGNGATAALFQIGHLRRAVPEQYY